VESPISTWPGRALVSNRAATLTASPIALKLRSSSLPMLPTSAGPVLTPTRNSGSPGPRTSATRRWTASAARAARSAWSCWRTGALNSAIIASPTNCTTVPPSASTAEVATAK
jgi:hypothetical protein